MRHQPGHLIDVMATCVDVAGAKYPAEFKGEKIQPPEGKSLVPAFANKPLGDRAIYWEHEGNRAVRLGDWKLVAKGRNGKWELYNMKTDRTELNDVSGENPDRVRKLAAMWAAYAKRTNVLPWPGKSRGKKKAKRKSR